MKKIIIISNFLIIFSTNVYGEWSEFSRGVSEGVETTLYINEEEISIRKEKIIEASLEATTAPYDIAEKSLDLLLLLPDFAKYANKNALTDLASASQLAESAAYIASLNVKINTPNLSKEDSRKYNIKIKNILKESKSLNENIQEICSSRIGW